MKRITLLAAVLAMTQSACIMVGGYSSRGGWFFFPGSLGLLLLLALLFIFLSRRGR
jgi:hypothetical protein